MAATAISLQLRPKRRPIANPNFLHFFSSSTPSDSTNADDQNTPPPPPQPQHRLSQSLREICRNLSPAPPPHDKSSPAATPLISFQELYKQRTENSTIQASNKGSGGRRSLDAIRESLRLFKSNESNSNNNNQINNNRDPTSPPPHDKSSPAATPSISFHELYKLYCLDKRRSENSTIQASNKGSGGWPLSDLRESLRLLNINKSNSNSNNNNQINNNRDPTSPPPHDKSSPAATPPISFQEKETEEKFVGGVRLEDVRQTPVMMQLSREEKNKKQMFQRPDVLGQLGGTPNFMLSPPKDQLVEKYFHPDNMSSSEKMKLELQKVR